MSSAYKLGFILGHGLSILIFFSMFYIIIWKFKSAPTQYYLPVLIAVEVAGVVYSLTRKEKKAWSEDVTS